jgi:hypothetical protein
VKYILISFLIYFTGCTQAQVYESLKHSDKYNCDDIINTQDRIECKEAPRKSYKEYHEYLQGQKK